jgi:signal transduction histidine kinase
MLKPEETRVLIVEDESLVSEMIHGVIEDIGYQVAGRACTGQQALEMIPRLRPDVILMDIKMPQMDGLEATRRISETFPTPVILLTAYESPGLIHQASAAGASAYLVKPPDPQVIARTIPLSISRFAEMMALRLVNQELQDKNQDLDAFAQMVAHELQGPLTLIKGYAQLLKMRSRLPEDMEDQLNTIARSSQKMGTVIKELLLLASIHRNNLPLKPLNMSRIVAEAQQRLTHLIEQHQAHISYPSAWPTALGHAPWIEEVWINYLSNAIKYGGQPPHIQLGATSTSDGYIRFWVRDNGPGLTSAEQARLFVPFTHLNQLHVEGEGLGLSIVRRIIEKLGGKTGVESEGIKGKGSLFYFTLPSAIPS